MNIIREGNPPKAEKGEWVSLDVEMFKMKKHLLHRPTTGRFACLTMCLERDPDTVYITELETSVPTYLSQADSGVIVFQNAKFDITQLRRYADLPPRKKLWDTMLIEQIMYSGYYDGFSLDDLARRYLYMKVDKSLQKDFAKINEMTDEHREYACRDTHLTLKIALEQRKVVSKTDFNIWKTVELPFLWALLDFRGFRINYDAWKENGEKLAKQVADLKASFGDLNPGSWQQVLEYFVKNGWKGIPNTRAETVAEWIEKKPDTKASRLAQDIISYRELSKYSSTYGLGMLERYAEEESPGVWVVYGDYWQIGAETSRTSCSDPNMQNQPNNNEHRSLFIARPGNKLVILDFSAQEPGISTYLSKDKRLMEINKSGEDVYVGMAQLFYRKKIKKSDPLRKSMKPLYLGVSYGLSKWGLAKREGIEVDEAEAKIDKFMKLFPGFARWAKNQRKEKKVVHTVLGRKIWLNPYSSQRERNALNGPHQGTGSEQMKMSIASLHGNWHEKIWKIINYKYPFSVVAEVHDEFILDVPEQYAEEIAEFARSEAVRIAEEMCPGVKFRVGVEIGDNWSAKE